MNEYQKNNPEINIAAEAAAALDLPQEALRKHIITAVTQTTDENLLRLVWSVLSQNKNEGESLRLFRHIDAIFESYPETLQKLAQ